MTKLQSVANSLRAMADEMEKRNAELALPEQGYTLQGAIDKIRASSNKEYVSLRMEITSYHPGGGKVEWSVYNEGTHFAGPTLADAVNALLEKCTPKRDGTVEECQDVIDQAVVEGPTEKANVLIPVNEPF